LKRFLNVFTSPILYRVGIVQRLHKIMDERVKNLENQIAELTATVNNLLSVQNQAFKGSLDDVLVERVLDTQLSGTPTTNTLLRNVTLSVSVPYSIVLSGDPETITGTLTGTGTIQVLDYPERIKIDTWKGQRLAIPVYNASDIIYP